MNSCEQSIDDRGLKTRADNEVGLPRAGMNPSRVFQGASFQSTNNCRADGDNAPAVSMSFLDFIYGCTRYVETFG